MGIMADDRGDIGGEARGDEPRHALPDLGRGLMAELQPNEPAQQEAKVRRRLHLRAVRGDKALETVGAELRAARLKRGEELDAVAAKLKIRKDILQALEESDYERQPPKVYAIGFVRAYAKFLGLDAEAMVRRYKTEISGRAPDKAPQLNFPETREDNAFPFVTLALVFAVVGLLGYGAWNLTQPVDVADAPQVVSEEEAQRLADEAARNQPGPLGLPADPALFAQQMAAPEAMAPKVYGDVDGAVRVTLRAAEDCYVRIRDLWADGGPKTIFEQTLMKGEAYRVPNRGGLTLRAGNAGGLLVEIDGNVVGALGRPGDTADRVSLMATKLLARFEGGSSPEPSRQTTAAEPRGASPQTPEPSPAAASPAAVPAPVTMSPVPN
jgi:cytoskeleton protein RodZ